MQDRAPCLTSGPQRGRTVTEREAGRAGEASTVLRAWELQNFVMLPYRFPRLASSSWGFHSCCIHPSACRTSWGPPPQQVWADIRLGRGPVGLRNSPKQPEHPPPVGDSAGKFKGGGVSLYVLFLYQQKRKGGVYQFLTQKNPKKLLSLEY